MNPEDNQSNPSLDQVAADLANAAPEVTPPETPATTEPVPSEPSIATPTSAEPVPAEPVSAESTPVEPAPAEPTTMEPAPTEPASVEPTPVEPTPVEPAPVAPTAVEPVAAAPAEPVAPIETTPMDSTSIDTTPVETTPDVSTDFTAESAPTTASFVGDAPAAPKVESSAEDEEPLKPADPVPGSIGSALAYSDSTPDHSTPVIKPKKTPMFDFKGNAKIIIMIVAAVVLVAVVVIILLFVLNGTSNKKAPTTNSNANTQPTVTTPVVSSLTCTLSGDGSAFSGYGDAVSGEENVIAMYSDDELTSLGINMTLNYDSEESANTGKSAAEQNYNSKYVSLKLTADPFLSTYDATGNVVTVTHQADGEKITTENAKVMDLFVLRGEVISDIETLKDTYEADGFTCVEK